MDKKVPRAEIRECMNTKDWKPVNKKTKNPAPLPSERLTTYVQTAVAEKWGKKWLILEVAPVGRAC